MTTDSFSCLITVNADWTQISTKSELRDADPFMRFEHRAVSDWLDGSPYNQWVQPLCLEVVDGRTFHFTYHITHRATAILFKLTFGGK